MDAFHIFAENIPCQAHNSKMLNENENTLYSVCAIDQIPKNIGKDVIDKALLRNQIQTGSLVQLLQIKVNARVMLTVSIDIADRLINGPIGTVKHIVRTINENILKMYAKFDYADAAGQERPNMWVPIEKAEASININVSKDSSPVIKRI